MNNSFFENNDIIVENEKYELHFLKVEEKELYIELYKETSILSRGKEVFDFDEFVEKQWNEIWNEDAVYISVIDKKKNVYVGNIVLRDLESQTPEIGIDILSRFRRQGYAYESLSLVRNKILENPMYDYLLVRIYSDNEPSRNLFSKLGAIEIGKEDSEYAAFVKSLKIKKPEIYEELISNNQEALRLIHLHYIIRYRLE